MARYAMTTEYEHVDPSTWRPQDRFRAAIGSHQQLKTFNEKGAVAVFLDVTRSTLPDIQIIGSQSRILSFWETSSRSGFVTKPKFSAGLLTIRFVTSGSISYLRRDGETVASPSIAALTGFDDLLEVRASSAVGAVSATIAVDALVSADGVLTGGSQRGLPAFEPIADMAGPGMSALFCTVRSIQRHLQSTDRHFDLMLPLLQEVMSYQLLSAWPRRHVPSRVPTSDTSLRQLQSAIDYIEANLRAELTLAEVAAAAGVGVRSLQIQFKKARGRTPVQFIIERRLTRTHEELISTLAPERSISEIARSWGFIHMSDFAQRYRRLFGCTPSQTRSNVSRNRRREVD